MNDDSALLRRYAHEGSERAFAELVSRHLGLVYHAALRQVGGDAHRAEEVAQTVFIDLARKAAELARRPLLAGWLHTSTRYAAVNLHRAERRRQIREQEAFAMNETLQAHASDLAWEDLRPVIDDALHALGERDREAVLLRFFEGLPFAAVGAKLSLTEDAARIRVERALEKIRRMLVGRGVTSTSAALATVLTSHAGAAAPAGLAAKISAATLVAGSGIGAGAAGLGLLALMTTSKTVALAGAIATLAVGIAVYQSVENKNSRASLAVAQKEQADLRAKVHELEQQLAASAARARAAEEEGATLLKTLEEAVQSGSTGSEQNPPATLSEVRERYAKGRELARNGRHPEALAEFIWCYDEGIAALTGPERDVSGLMQSQVAEQLVALGRTYPPALEAVRERRNRAEQALLEIGIESEVGAGTASTLSKLNNALGENDRTLRFYDRLPPNDWRRITLSGEFVFDELAKSRRYDEAAIMKPDRLMHSDFETHARVAESVLDHHPNAETVRRQKRSRAITLGVRYAEVMAGVGELKHARSLAVRLLDFDASPETRAALQQALYRAGQPQLMDSITP